MSRHGLEIRAATPADAPGLAELLAAAGQPPVAATTLVRRLAGLCHAPGAVLLVLEWGPPSGIIVLHWHPTLDQDLLSAHVTTLLVAPDHRRRGIGRLLVKAGAQAGRSAGCGTLVMAVSPLCHELRAFSEATGFAQDSERFTRALRRRASPA